MYVGVLLLLCGEALFFKSALVLGYALLIFLIFHVFVIAYEEPWLRHRFGMSYDEYASTVGRWIPTFGTRKAGEPT